MLKKTGLLHTGHVLPGGKACPTMSFLIWCWAAAASKAKSTQTRENTHFQNRTVMLHAGERQTKAGVLCVGGDKHPAAALPSHTETISHDDFPNRRPTVPLL